MKIFSNFRPLWDGLGVQDTQCFSQSQSILLYQLINLYCFFFDDHILASIAVLFWSTPCLDVLCQIVTFVLQGLTTEPTANRYVEFLILHFRKYIIRLVFICFYTPRKQSFGSGVFRNHRIRLSVQNSCPYCTDMSSKVFKPGWVFLLRTKIHKSKMCILLKCWFLIIHDAEDKGRCNTPWPSCHRYTNLLELSANKTCNISHI